MTTFVTGDDGRLGAALRPLDEGAGRQFSDPAGSAQDGALLLARGAAHGEAAQRKTHKDTDNLSRRA
jgi:hypothetical protein